MHLSACMLTLRLEVQVTCSHCSVAMGSHSVRTMLHVVPAQLLCHVQCLLNVPIQEPSLYLLPRTPRRCVRSACSVFFEALPHAQLFCPDHVAGVLTSNLRMVIFHTISN